MQVGLEKKMERLMEDSMNIKNLLPWIESDADIINFIRKIPLDKSHLRIQLTLKHFIKKRDCHSDGFEKEIEDDAREIVVVLPDTSYKEIKEKLSILGNVPNRKEVVLRQLLHKKRDLDKMLRDINVSSAKKRKTESSSDDIFGLDSRENHTNINIKIRKVDGNLEVVSRISSQEKSSTSKTSSDSDGLTDEPTTSSVTSSTNQSSNSSPDSTVPSTERDDPCPEFTTILNNLINERTNSPTSGSVMSTNASAVPSIRNTIGSASTTNVDNYKDVIEVLASPSEEKPKPEITEVPDNWNNYNAANTIPRFNLIGFVKELSSAPEIKIFHLCKQMGLNLNERPSDTKLNVLLNKLLDDVVEIGSAGSSDTDSDNQEYFSDMEGYPNVLGVHSFAGSHKKNRKVSVMDASFIVNANKDRFKLKPATLNVQRPVRNYFQYRQPPDDTYFPPSPPGPTQMNMVPVIQPARFNPDNTRVHTFPAMPSRFLNLMNPRTLGDEEPAGNTDPLPSTSGTTFNVEEVEQVNENSEGTALNLSMNEDLEGDMQVDEEAAAGPSVSNQQKQRVLDQNLVLRLIEMFPEACPDYIRDVCDGKQWTDLDDVVTIILSAPYYPRRPERIPSPPKEVDPEEQYQIIKELLPDADPTYLRMQCETFANNEKGLKEFINTAMELKDYPTMKEYLRKQQLSAQQKQYTTEFNIENFIQLFPEPEKTFDDPQRTRKTDNYSAHYLTTYFKNRYDRISVRYIQQILMKNNFKVLTCDRLFREMVATNDLMKSRRKPTPLPDNLQNIPLLQEVAYLTHKEEIENYLLDKKAKEEQERLDAKANGLVETCLCCYDEEVMPKDTFHCPSGCKFCRDCIKKSCEVAMGEGKTVFPCLSACPNEFSLQTLQDALPPKMFSKLAQKKALAEIKAAGIEELEMCPFCDFASIPNEADKIFRCLNPECMKESCRKCKEPNHVPLKCEEVEKDQDVKARTYIENKMTEALIRKCWKCGTSFFKEEGCNKMTCSCGAHMCYICQKPVTDYTHFNGIGGDKFDRCPLYSDTNLVNQENVLGAAAAAKAEINPTNLKVDPTVGITDHFKSRAKKLPREPHLDILHRMHRHEGRHRHRHRHRNHAQNLAPQRQHYLQLLIEHEWQMQE